MPLTSLSAPEPGPEAPTACAELKIEVGPAQPWESPKGKVMPDQAHDLITTCGVLGSVIAGIAGAVLTLRRSSGLTAPALAELALAGASAALIATRRADRRTVGTRRPLERQTPSRRTETSLAAGNPAPAPLRAKHVLRRRAAMGGPGASRIPSRGSGCVDLLGCDGPSACACPHAKIILHVASVTADSPLARGLQQKTVDRLLYGQQI